MGAARTCHIMNIHNSSLTCYHGIPSLRSPRCPPLSLSLAEHCLFPPVCLVLCVSSCVSAAAPFHHLCHNQGKLKAYSPQTGKFTLQYDDGQCESLLLERERFIWHAPRGSTAGYKPALHVLMQQLGAEGLKGLLTQQEGPDGKVVPLTPRPEVR